MQHRGRLSKEKEKASPENAESNPKSSNKKVTKTNLRETTGNEKEVRKETNRNQEVTTDARDQLGTNGEHQQRTLHPWHDPRESNREH